MADRSVDATPTSKVGLWTDSGLYDSSVPNADDRLALLHWLDEQGVTLEEMVEAHKTGRLFAIVGDRIARGSGPRLDAEACARVAGMSREEFVYLWRAIGFPEPSPDMPLLTEPEAESFQVVKFAFDVLGKAPGERLAMTIGHAMRLIAEAVNVAFIEADDRTMLDRSGSELVSAQTDALFDSMIPAFHRWLAVLHALNHESSNRHLELVYGLAESREVVRLAVGFADVSGFPWGGDYFGPTVNLAARLCGAAGDGHVLVDGEAAIGWRSYGRAVDQGTRTLKGVEGPVTVWRAQT
jgi:hypothetical protein